MSDTQIDNRLRIVLACLLCGIYLLVYVPKINSGDGEAILAVTASTIRHGLPDIGVMGADDALQPFDSSRMGTFGVDGAYYSKKGVTPSVILAPLVLLAEALPWLDTRATAMLFNPLVTTATALALYTLVRWLGYHPRTAFIVGLLYGTATLAITYVKTLFGEPLAALLLILAVMNVYRYRENGNWRALVVAGGLLGLMAGVNLIYVAVAPVLAAFAFLPFRVGERDKKRIISELAAFAIPFLACIALLGVYNWARFGSPTSTGYHFAEGEGFTKPLLAGIYGLTIGSYRGLFWYNPLLLLAIPGWLMLRRASSRLAWLALALIALQIVSFASWWSWDGGIVWGPRFLLTILPLAALCLAPLVEAAWKKPIIAAVLIGFAVLSFGVQLLGALYSITPYIAYLYQHFYVPTLPGLSDEVMNPAVSPIVGHAALALAGWPLEPAWAANGVDVVHLLSALGVMVVGIVVGLSKIKMRWAGLVAALAIIVSLNIVAARQQHGSDFDKVQALQNTLQPAGMVVAESTLFGESLVDVDNGSWVISTNAPTAPDDPLTNALWKFATGKAGNLWLLTWFQPGDPQNWQERDLWTTSAFAEEKQVAGHRALLFNTTPIPPPDQAVGVHFGEIRLDKYGVQEVRGGLIVTVQWSAAEQPSGNYSWFVHLLDANGQIVAQQDRQPQGGYAPTSSWKAGEPVIDRLFFPNIQAQGSQLRIGFVNPATGDKLATTDANGKAVTDGFVLLPIQR